MHTPEQIETLKKFKIAKIKCLDDFQYFTRYYHYHTFGQKFSVNFHHDLIIDELKLIENYKTLFLNINMPPRYSKTVLAAVMFIAHSLAKNPKARFLYITGSAQLAHETSTAIKDIVTSERYQQMFGVTLRPDKKAKGLWATDQGGGVYAVTILGQITGFGAGILYDPDSLDEIIRDFDGCIILDDINKIDEAEYNTATNEKVNRRIFNTVLSRVNDKNTPLINIQQRSGIEDATARLLAHFKEFLKDEPQRLRSLALPILYNGKPLWELKHDLNDIENLRTSPETAHIFETQYMQNPSPRAGLCFAKDDLQYFKLSDLRRDNLVGVNSAIDTADTGTDDYSHPFGELIENKCYITDAIFNKEPLSNNKQRSIYKIREKQCMITIVETNKEGQLYKDSLQLELPEFNIYGQWNSTNKHGRIIMFEEFIKKFFVFLDATEYETGSEYHRFMQCMWRYARDGSSKHDDAPDSCSILAKFLFNNYTHLFSNYHREENN